VVIEPRELIACPEARQYADAIVSDHKFKLPVSPLKAGNSRFDSLGVIAKIVAQFSERCGELHRNPDVESRLNSTSLRGEKELDSPCLAGFIISERPSNPPQRPPPSYPLKLMPEHHPEKR
jgi:hypothetical protein